MIRNARLIFSYALMLLFASTLYIGCGGDNNTNKGECTKNADCAKKGADYQCEIGKDKVGKCVKKNGGGENKTCPDSCSADTDCANCTDGKTSCVNGKCDKKGGENKTCPDSCTGNGDCANCSDGRNACVNGTCQKPANNDKCPASCNSDADCNVAACGNKTSCKNGVCAEAGGNNDKCPASCNVDADCNVPACGNKTSCKNGVCSEAGGNQGGGSKKVGESCDPKANNCESGAICLMVSQTEAYCFKDCTKDSSVCGADVCLTVTKNGIKVCLKEANKGEDCGIAHKQTICKRGQKPPLYCSPSTQKCKEAQVVGEGEACNKEGDNTEPIKICDPDKKLTCDPNSGKCIKLQTAKTLEACGGNTGKACDSADLCVTLSQGAKHGFCLRKCDPKAPQCPNNGRCVPLQNGGGACLPAGTLGADKRCAASTTGNKIDPNTQCAKGLLCIVFSQGASTGLCLQHVKSCGANACPQGRKCLALRDNSGICANDCTQADNCPKPDTMCVPLQSGDKICAPAPEYGPNDFGAVCKEPAKQFGCKQGLFCLTVSQQAAAGYCSRDCTKDGKCGTAKDAAGKDLAATCVQASKTRKFCLFPCTQPGSTCPVGLTCVALQSGDKFCLVR